MRSLLFFLFVFFLASNGAQGQTRTIIARGECQHVHWASRVTCPIPMTSPDMTLEVMVIYNKGTNRCVKNTNFGLAADNSHIWVSGGCWGYFVVERITGATTTAAPTTTTTATTISPGVSTDGTPTWGPWSPWAPCSATCGGGTRTRTRVCSTGIDRDCVSLFSYNSQAETCNEGACPVATTPSGITSGTGSNTSSSGSTTCGLANSFRIVGGTDAGACEFPWMVLVYNVKLGTICGGSILGDRHVLTAAHCLTITNALGQPSQVLTTDILILSGSSAMPVGIRVTGVARTAVAEIFRHEAYDDNTLYNDIAVLKTSQPFPQNNCHRAICLPSGRKLPQEAVDCKSMGWGRNSNGPEGTIQSSLQWAAETVTSDAQCAGRFGRFGTDTAFCAMGNNAGSCQGDSGGPLACKEPNGQYVQYGVVSGGVDNNCGTLEGLYTRVGTFIAWIHDTMAK